MYMIFGGGYSIFDLLGELRVGAGHRDRGYDEEVNVNSKV